MSASNNCSSDDVLSEIFQILDVPDLLSCTKVCRKWRCVIESLVFGRMFFQQLKKSSAAWRRAWRKLAQDETNLKGEDCKDIRWSCLQYLKQVDDNWRAGIYKLKTSRYYFYCDGRVIAVGEDFITMSCGSEDVQIFDRESVELKNEFRPSYPEYRIIDANTVVYLESKGLTFHDTNTGQLIRRFELNDSPSRFDACCPTAKLWTVRADFESVLRLTLFRVDNDLNVILIKTMEVPRIHKLQVDEQFILHQLSASTCHFISTGIVHDTVLERSLSVMSRWWFYDRGLMFIIKRDGLIRILDVASGTYLHDIDMGKSDNYLRILDIKANSNYVVIFDRSNLYVYSLQALRNPLPSNAFVFKIKHNHKELYRVLVDETQIVCLGENHFSFGTKQIFVYDFGSFD